MKTRNSEHKILFRWLEIEYSDGVDMQ